METGSGCKIDGIEIRKVSITVTSLGPQLEVVFALVDSKTKEVHGWKRKRMPWPPSVVKPLKDFITALESLGAGDLFSDHAAGGGTPVSLSEYLQKAETQR